MGKADDAMMMQGDAMMRREQMMMMMTMMKMTCDVLRMGQLNDVMGERR